MFTSREERMEMLWRCVRSSVQAWLSPSWSLKLGHGVLCHTEPTTKKVTHELIVLRCNCTLSLTAREIQGRCFSRTQKGSSDVSQGKESWGPCRHSQMLQYSFGRDTKREAENYTLQSPFLGSDMTSQKPLVTSNTNVAFHARLFICSFCLKHLGKFL